MLRKIIGGTLLSISVISGNSQTQSETQSIIQGTYLGISHLQGTEVHQDENGIADEYYEINNFQDRHRTSPVERNLYPQVDPIWQQTGFSKRAFKAPTSTLIENYNGIGNTNVNPPDPCVAAGPNHVIQMVNGGGGALYKIYDKNGNALTGNVNFDNLFAGYSGLGDPIVIYDQLADRWLLSEFSYSGNLLLVAISLTNDPTGNFHTYVFAADNFPDYPKYAVWPNAYYCTANENLPSIYAFERDSMLVGAPARLIRQSVSGLPRFGFQTLTPVNFEGTNIPNTPTTASFWRHVDDEAHYPSIANPFNDYVEYWQLEPNFDSLTNSVFTGPFQIPVTEFDSDLNGYFAFSAIQQKNTSIRLDPLREVFMNRMAYRNFGAYEAMVACHVTDVDGTDRAGMRWYEFRKTNTTDWHLFQEGTFSPTSDSRWMGAIEINANGSICMAYSVSSNTMFPSLRYTGRNINDPLGIMTIPEQSLVEGSAANYANRYGDYAAMTIDPSNDSTFWFTGEYNPSSSWGTRIAHISISDSCFGLSALITPFDSSNCDGTPLGKIEIQGVNGSSTNYSYSIDGSNFVTHSVFNNLSSGNYPIFVSDGSCSVLVDSIKIISPAAVSSTYSITHPSSSSSGNGSILVSPTGGTPPFTYSIDVDTNYQSDSLFTGIFSGTYTLYTQDFNQCKYSEDVHISSLSVNELLDVQGLVVYPNPTQGNLRVTVSSKMAENGIIYSLRDVTGKEVIHVKMAPNPNKVTQVFDLSSFSRGIYVLTVENDENSISSKIILE